MNGGILFDLSGVLHVGDELLPGAADALVRAREAGLAVRFVTNTTRKTRRALVEQLRGLGLELDADEVFTAPVAARAYCRNHDLHPFLLVHPDLRPDLEDLESDAPDAVLVADAGEAFTYASMNAAFRVLMQDRPLIAIVKNRYFEDGGRLSLDAGPFVAALEYACGTEAALIGKPAAAFFDAAVRDMDLEPDDVTMIGDDVEADVCGAVDAGLRAILVRTGKFRNGDEERMPDGAGLAADVVEAVARIVQREG